MSNKSVAGRAAGLILAASIIVARGAAAQSVAEYTRVVDSLGTIWQSQARELAAAADSVRRAHVLRDTLHVGHFVIVADSEHLSLARAAAERVSPMLDRSYGKSAARLESHVFTVRRGTPEKGDSTPVTESGILDEKGGVRFAYRGMPDVGVLSRAWQSTAAEMISSSLPAELRTWVNQPIPVEGVTAAEINTGRIDLVLTSSQSARDCAMGSVPRCLQALALTPVSDPAFDLFNHDERQAMIERNATRFRRADPARYDRCNVDHVQATCDSLVHDIPLDVVPAATSPAVRRSFLHYALQLGGSGAFDRLASAQGPLENRIAAAAGVPIDSVVRRWQQTLMASQSVSKALDLQTALSAALWAAACCALALRSSRWR